MCFDMYFRKCLETIFVHRHHDFDIQQCIHYMCISLDLRTLNSKFTVHLMNSKHIGLFYFSFFLSK